MPRGLDPLIDVQHAHADARRLRKDCKDTLLLVVLCDQNGKHLRGAVLLHADRRRPDIEGAECEKTFAHIAEELRIHIVDIRLDEREIALAVPLVLSDVDPHDIRQIEFPCACPISNALCQKVCGHMAGEFCERSENSSSRRRRQLLRRALMVRREKAQKFRCRRRRHHHETMLRIYRAASRIYA